MALLRKFTPPAVPDHRITFEESREGSEVVVSVIKDGKQVGQGRGLLAEYAYDRAFDLALDVMEGRRG